MGRVVLTLPAHHSQDELVVARRLAELLDSGELHVFWTAEPEPPGRPAAGKQHSPLGRLLRLFAHLVRG